MRFFSTLKEIWPNNQINKFYLSSFLKNQTYFTPIFILFLQFYKLTYTEIFWVYTIAAVASVILEIPTGIMADLIGKKKTMAIARGFTLIAFLVYGFSSSFIMFVIAQLLITIGEAFKSGTDVAYIFDYLKQKAPKINYTEVKGKQKFWARIGEAISASIGGFIAGIFGFNTVFFFAAIPALLNLILIFRFEDIKETQIKKDFKKHITKHITDSYKEIKGNKQLIKIILNISLFITVMTGSQTFLQPYMQEAGIPIEWFGIIYAVFFIMTAFAVRYSYILEDRLEKPQIINWITFIAIIPLLVLGLGYISFIGIFFFFMIVMGENIRSPIANHLFHEHVSSKRRATLGSILMMSRNLGKAIFLPLFGFIADISTFYTSLLIMAGIMLVNWIFFRVNKD